MPPETCPPRCNRIVGPTYSLSKELAGGSSSLGSPEAQLVARHSVGWGTSLRQAPDLWGQSSG